MSQIDSMNSDIDGEELVIIRDVSPLLSEPRILEHKFDLALIDDHLDELDALKIEALVALEETLRQQIDILLCREKQFDDMTERLSAMNRDLLSSLMDRNKEVKEQDGAVTRDVKDFIAERDQAMKDLRNVEQAFSDVHTKYERAKVTIENFKINEEHLMERDEQLQLAISARDQKYEAFKQEAEQSIEKIYNDFQGKIAALDADCGRLTALLRRVEMRAETLQAELDHKKKENGELNKLADELIGRASGSNTMLM